MLTNEFSNKIRNYSRSSEVWLLDNFAHALRYLYSHEVFKNILDFVMTKCKEGKLEFVVQDMKLFDIDSGTCLTMVSSQGDRKYLITIKKIASDVIMHEIGHMLEKELLHLIDINRFIGLVLYEVQSVPIYMKSVVNRLFVEEVNLYPEPQRGGEIIARFFQFFAGARELCYQSSINASYKLSDASSVFQMSLAFLDSELGNKWNNLIDPQVAKDSESYTRDDHKPQWSQSRIGSKNCTTTETRWRVRSNKSNPFK